MLWINNFAEIFNNWKKKIKVGYILSYVVIVFYIDLVHLVCVKNEAFN